MFKMRREVNQPQDLVCGGVPVLPFCPCPRLVYTITHLAHLDRFLSERSLSPDYNHGNHNLRLVRLIAQTSAREFCLP